MADINEAYRLQMFNSTEQYPSLLYSNKIMKKQFKKQFQEEFNKVFDEAFEKRFSELFDKYYEKKVELSNYNSYFSYLYCNSII